VNTVTVQNFRLVAAMDYAARGWRVVPLHWPKVGPTLPAKCSCGKADCASSGKHPLTRNGLKDGSTDPAVIGAWWRQWPAANVGLVAGAESGFVALDVDPGKGGAESLGEMMSAYGELPETVEARTGSGGTHLLFRHPGKPVANTTNRPGKGLDVRGDGGYIVAPPSLHACGERYVWIDGAGPAQAGLSDAPAWLYSLLADPKPAMRTNTTLGQSDDAMYWLGKALARCTEGNRNETGFWLACQLRDSAVTESAATPVMRDYAARVPRGEKPYAEREAMASLREAYEKPAREPARTPSYAAQTIRATAPPAVAIPGAGEELVGYIEDVIAGRVYNVHWPWPILTRLTQALLPGSMVSVVGDPGVGKTFLTLECAQFWTGNGIEWAAYFLEKNRLFYSRRLLAQLAAKGDLTDLEWIKRNPEAARLATEENREMIALIGRNLHTSPADRVTLDSLLGWVRQQASAGKRVLVIDPITAVSAGAERWTKDDDFVVAAQAVLNAHGASLVFVNHPKKGNRPGAATGHDQAGGAAYFRFTDANIWVAKTKKPRKVRYETKFGPAEGKFDLFFHLLKTRDGRGAGMELAYVFGQDLRFYEKGMVLRDVPDDETEEAA
jgi:hypothetical protein